MSLLFDYTQKDIETMNMLKNSAIFFIPALNYDGLTYIGQTFKNQETTSGLSDSEDLTYLYLSKNRHDYADQKTTCPSKELRGVDLTRNYDWKFAHDEDGSSGDICSGIYRGPNAFSEPETQAVRKLVERYPNIRLALNLHAYGNTLNIPFNYADEDLENTHPHIKDYFERVLEYAPEGATLGNKVLNKGRPVNGEVSDWMFGAHDILAVTADLGLDDISTMTYYIKSRDDLKSVVHENHKWIAYAASTLLPHLTVDLNKWTQTSDNWHAVFDVSNTGVGSLENQTVYLYFNSAIFSAELTFNGELLHVNCTTTTVCHVVLKQVPSLLTHKLDVKIRQMEDTTVLKEEDFRLEYNQQ